MQLVIPRDQTNTSVARDQAHDSVPGTWTASPSRTRAPWAGSVPGQAASGTTGAVFSARMSDAATAATAPDSRSGPEATTGDAAAGERRVTMVTTPGDGSCGIGTYARDLQGGIDGCETATVTLPQDEQTVRAFVSTAVRAVLDGGDVVHVQHEYGLFRRDGSRYPGVLGLVFFPVLFALAGLRRTPVVVTLHSVLSPDPADARFSVRLYLLVFHKLLASRAAHLFFLAPDCERRFLADIDLPDDAYSVLPHGVNTETPVDVARPTAKRRLGYDPDDDLVLIPGFVRPPKGHDVFVEVARRLPEYEFVVAGGARPKGDDFAFAARIRSDAPSNVTVTGVLDDRAFWTALAAPDLALLPYRVVTQSGTFNCCAARELPVLASDERYFTRLEAKWGVPETVDVSDLDAVVNRVRALLEDDARRRRLGRAMSHYRRANSFDYVGRRHVRVYRRVCSEGVPTPVAESREPESRTPDVGVAACSAQRTAHTD